MRTGRSARTHAPTPRACVQIAPDRPSVAGTPADKRFGSGASDTSKINFKGVHQTGSTPAEPLRHRQTKGAETDMLSLTSPRHTSTLPIRDIASTSQLRKYRSLPEAAPNGSDRPEAGIPEGLGKGRNPQEAVVHYRTVTTPFADHGCRSVTSLVGRPWQDRRLRLRRSKDRCRNIPGAISPG